MTKAHDLSFAEVLYNPNFGARVLPVEMGSLFYAAHTRMRIPTNTYKMAARLPLSQLCLLFI